MYQSPEEIDDAMFNRFVGKKQFKVGQTERIVYQKVSGMKRPNALLSILYNFSSEGAFTPMQMPIGLIGATPDDIHFGQEQEEIVQNVKMQILLDRLSWLSDSVVL